MISDGKNKSNQTLVNLNCLLNLSLHPTVGVDQLVPFRMKCLISIRHFHSINKTMTMFNINH